MISNSTSAAELAVGTIGESTLLAKNTYQLSVAVPVLCHGIVPGQFYMLKGWDGNEPLLRRPFSVSDVRGENVVFLIKVTGRGTELITNLGKGDRISLLGPLGNGFGVENGVEKHIFVAGGVGIAPFPLLGKALRREDSSADIELLYGERDESSLVDLDMLDLRGISVTLMTEDGSRGRKGVVTRLLEERLRSEDSSRAIYACGPVAMLKELQSRAAGHPGPLQFSLESHMGCGMGSCQGCVVQVLENGEQAYQRVCYTGPVFDGRKVIF